MTEFERARKQAEVYKKLYPVGTRVVVNKMNDKYHPVEPGTRGTVKFVDDMGNIHVSWDSGIYKETPPY